MLSCGRTGTSCQATVLGTEPRGAACEVGCASAIASSWQWDAGSARGGGVLPPKWRFPHGRVRIPSCKSRPVSEGIYRYWPRLLPRVRPSRVSSSGPCPGHCPVLRGDAFPYPGRGGLRISESCAVYACCTAEEGFGIIPACYPPKWWENWENSGAAYVSSPVSPRACSILYHPTVTALPGRVSQGVFPQKAWTTLAIRTRSCIVPRRIMCKPTSSGGLWGLGPRVRRIRSIRTISLIWQGGRRIYLILQKW